MWYKIKFPPYSNEYFLKNYLCYDYHKGFYLTNRSRSLYFKREHIIYDNKLKKFLNNKDYILEECDGEYTFLIYRGNTS